MKTRITRTIGVLLALTIALVSPLAPSFSPLAPEIAYAQGFIDFEDGVDGQAIRTTIPGLQFITTDGQDWIYGDWRTGEYNGKYPNGRYTSNGNFFAWLGPNQGQGIIEFTEGGATYLQVGVSTGNIVTLRGYADDNTLLDEESLYGGNLDTGFTNALRIETTDSRRFSYAIVSGNANYWLIDDLSTDAAGVPTTKTPLIFIPGIMGSTLDNRNGEVWPNPKELILDRDDDSLRVLRLGYDGESPLETDNPDYTSIRVGGVLLGITAEVLGQKRDIDIYGSLFEYLGERGYSSSATFFTFAYDWRKDNAANADLLAAYIDDIKTTLDVPKVNILAHSMGGLIARLYISDTGRAENVDTLVTLGTPYLGAPKSFDVLHYGHECMIKFKILCLLNSSTAKDMVQNMPAAYQLLPGPNYHRVYPNGHLYIDRDVDGDGQREGQQSFAEIKSLIQQNHNGPIFEGAGNVFDLVESYADGTNGVKVYVFVGMKQDTPGTVREFMQTTRRGERVAYDMNVTNGDGTVPLHSADLGRTLGDNDFSGEVSYYYARLNHEELPQYSGDGEKVLELVANIFENDETAHLLASRAGSRTFSQDTLLLDATVNDAAVFIPTTREEEQPITLEPEPLSGRQIIVQGDTLLKITDSIGNVSQVTADDFIESSIPGSGVYRIGSTTSIFVPDGQLYLIEVSGQQDDDSADLRLREIVQDVITTTILFKDIPINVGSVATMTYDPAGGEIPHLNVDLEGDGVVDEVKAPDAVLDGKESTDISPPTSLITIEYPPVGNDAQATITINALDEEEGSGVSHVQYSFDGWKTVYSYTSPLTVNMTNVSEIWAKAVDKAGNEQYPLTEATITQRVFLPMLLR